MPLYETYTLVNYAMITEDSMVTKVFRVNQFGTFPRIGKPFAASPVHFTVIPVVQNECRNR